MTWKSLVFFLLLSLGLGGCYDATRSINCTMYGLNCPPRQGQPVPPIPPEKGS